jgi:channel protein (hemolysin III family)
MVIVRALRWFGNTAKGHRRAATHRRDRVKSASSVRRVPGPPDTTQMTPSTVLQHIAVVHRTATLVIAWGGTLIGVALQWIPLAIPRPVFAVVYLIVGWSVAPFLPQLFDGLGALGFSLLLAGGLAYSAGAVVYSLRRPDPWPTVFGYHEVFHLLTVIGAALHFTAIALVAVPRL